MLHAMFILGSLFLIVWVYRLFDHIYRTAQREERDAEMVLHSVYCNVCGYYYSPNFNSCPNCKRAGK